MGVHLAAAVAVLLRGVNVNGRTLRSADLRACLAGIEGVTACTTVLASGNAVVWSERPLAALTAAVDIALREQLDPTLWGVVLPVPEVERLAAVCPFPPDDPQQHAYVTVATDEHVLDAFDGSHGEVRLSPVALAWATAVGTSTDSPVPAMLSRKAFRESTTTRNVRTLVRLTAAAARR